MLNESGKSVLNAIVMPVMSFENGKAVWMNNRCKQLLNIKEISDLKERGFWEYIDLKQAGQRSVDDVINEISKALAKGKACGSKIKIALKIKGMRVETVLTIVPTECGLPYSGTVIFDRLRRKEDLQVRRKTANYYGDLFKQVSTPIIICDCSDRVVESNEAFCDLFGYSRDEALDRYCYDLIAPPGEKINFIQMCEAIHLKGVQNRRLKVSDKWGGIIDVEFTSHPILQDGNIIGTYRMYDDRRKENTVRNELALQKAYFEGLFNTSAEALVLSSNDDRVVYCNDAFEELFGYTIYEAKGKLINDIVAIGDTRNEAEIISEKALRSEGMRTKTVRYRRDGLAIPVELTVNPITKDGKLLGIYGVYKNLTEESQIERELKIQSQYFNKLFESSLDAMVLMDWDQNIIDSNKTFEKLFGYAKEESHGQNIDDLLVPEEYKGEALEFESAMHNRKTIKKETRRIAKDKSLIDVEAHGYPVIIENKPVGILVNYRDIRERKRMLEKLDEQWAYFKQLFDNSPQGIAIIDTEDNVVNVNKGFCSMFEYDIHETKGVLINDLIAPGDIRNEADRLSAELFDKGIVRFETKRRSSAGRMIDVDILAYPVILNNKQVGGYAIYSDITSKKQAEREIEFLAYRDSLTGLFNRKVFYDKLRQKMKTITKDEKLAVCYIDLNGFKKVNDNMGHSVGDELLRYVAKNIEDSVGKKDVVARMGGDEFVILTDYSNHEEISRKMETIIEKLNSGLEILDFRIKIALSIGVAIYPEHGIVAEEIVKKADTAMYQVKQDGLSGYRIYTEEMGRKDSYLFEVENRLRVALANGEIGMHYQPICDMGGTVKGCEALMRWENAVLGKVSPEVFIPIAEDNGEIMQLGAFALNRALATLKKWQETLYEDFFMSINLSVKQIENENVVDSISEALGRHGIKGESIHLEVTESCSTENIPNLKEKLCMLKEMGISISIDDFGTGYSSFRQLRDSNIDFIKIDRSFVEGIDGRTDNRAIVKAIVAMGKSLNAGIIAEGVETNEELKTMKRLGCDMYQGFLMQRPADEEAIKTFIGGKI